MPTIFNGELIKSLIKKAGLQPSREAVPSQLAEKIVPVMETSPDKYVQRANGTATNAATAVIHTTSATRRTFLIALQQNYVKDASNPGNYTDISGFPKGLSATKILLMQRYTGSSAGFGDASLSLPIPLELEKNTEVTLINGSGTAAITATGVIYFYEVD